MPVNALHADERPNVLFFFADDQPFNTLGCTGNTIAQTPSIDAIAQRGVIFDNAYIMGGTSPAVCSPSRAMLFSGRTLWNLDNQGMWGFEISDKYITFPQVFKDAGYTTWATGKNEPGKAGHFLRSFSAGDKILFRGMTRSQYNMPLFSYPADGTFKGKKPVTHRDKHSAEIYADATINFLQNRAEDAPPFFAYVAFQTPHDPRQSPPAFRERYRDEEMPLPKAYMPTHPFDNGMLKIRDEKLAGFPRTKEEIKTHLADFYATMEHTDTQIGRVLDALEKSGELDNTIIVYTADNGLALGSHGLVGKQNVYDHSVHVPLIIAGPGIPKAQRREQLAYIYDLIPTLIERANLTTPDTVQFKSLNKAIDDADAPHRAHLTYAFMDWQRAIQKDGYKLIEYCVNGDRHTQLFHLANDRHELNNLANEATQAERLATLRNLLRTESKRLNDGNTPSEFTTKMGKSFWQTFFGRPMP
ncbi:MAG: sulfatase-like hydrolase/transferase [Phycisphaeraceae bacterium]